MKWLMALVLFVLVAVPPWGPCLEWPACVVRPESKPAVFLPIIGG